MHIACKATITVIITLNTDVKSTVADIIILHVCIQYKVTTEKQVLFIIKRSLILEMSTVHSSDDLLSGVHERWDVEADG